MCVQFGFSSAPGVVEVVPYTDFARAHEHHMVSGVRTLYHILLDTVCRLEVYYWILCVVWKYMYRTYSALRGTLTFVEVPLCGYQISNQKRLCESIRIY